MVGRISRSSASLETGEISCGARILAVEARRRRVWPGRTSSRRGRETARSEATTVLRADSGAEAGGGAAWSERRGIRYCDILQAKG